MSLVDKRCQEELLDYFEKKNVPMVHIILEAEKETIISRIENDPIRDNNAQNQQKSKIDWQIQYLSAQGQLCDPAAKQCFRSLAG